MNITCDFDSGSIDVLDAADPKNVRLALRPENATDLVLWFYFRASGVKGVDCRYRIENASASLWAYVWKKYRVAYTYDRRTWFRLPVQYDGTTLSFRHKPEFDSVFYAYAPPYTREQDFDLVARAQLSPHVRHEVLGQSLDGQDIDLLTIGKPGRDKFAIWVTTRHHPSETQGPYAVEGLVHRLIDEDDALARAALKRCVFYVVPNINPDGARRGNHRHNANGTDLNRAWTDTTMEASPEVFLVRKRILATGLDVFLDLHADERITFAWGLRTPGIPSWNKRIKGLTDAFEDGMQRANPDHETGRKSFSYPARTDPLAMGASWAAETFKTFAMIIEFPFLDEDNKDPRLSWPPERSRRYGASLVDAIVGMLDAIGTPWATKRRRKG